MLEVSLDCSIRDCKDNCSRHGWCSIEFPVSRCICRSPYVGPTCKVKTCLNDCSPPNGECIDGKCHCKHTYNPYNNTVVFQGSGPRKGNRRTDEQRMKGWNEEKDRLGYSSFSGDYQGTDCSFIVVFAAGSLKAPTIYLWGTMMLLTFICQAL